ncbi:MAG: imidazole glycerol phosphate synthase subunit HisH [Candidatus Omnitrophica bacterium]|nr:imidazole glycerol phosphate synthase subunit HisH [Candidatus Omnitrophota bacterium]MBU4590046.1 imidazole glycerol phosphate synthase subunit HisH [Candidatus Omnitrophota bacterium]
MITIVDYGMGNLRSVQKAFELFCPKVRVSSSARDIAAASKVVLPGVGAFGKAMEELEKKGLVDALKDAIKSGRPFLGICLGIQLLFPESEEAGRVKGLGILKGKVRKFDNSLGLKIPHMGWNKIKFKDQDSRSRILEGVPDGSHMYFVHSYYVEPEDKDAVLCETEYGDIFASAIQKDNIYAFQFHPEKSQKIGLNIVKNFAEL